MSKVEALKQYNNKIIIYSARQMGIHRVVLSVNLRYLPLSLLK